MILGVYKLIPAHLLYSSLSLAKVRKTRYSHAYKGGDTSMPSSKIIIRSGGEVGNQISSTALITPSRVYLRCTCSRPCVL